MDLVGELIAQHQDSQRFVVLWRWRNDARRDFDNWLILLLARGLTLRFKAKQAEKSAPTRYLVAGLTRQDDGAGVFLAPALRLRHAA